MSALQYTLGMIADNAAETYYEQKFSSKAALANFLVLLCARVTGENSNFLVWNGYDDEKTPLTTPEDLIDFCLDKHLYSLELNSAAGPYFQEAGTDAPGTWRGTPEQTLHEDDIQQALRRWAQRQQAPAEKTAASGIWKIAPQTATITTENLFGYVVSQYTGTQLTADLAAARPGALNFITEPALIDFYHARFFASINEEVSLNEVRAYFPKDCAPKEADLKAQQVNLAIYGVLSAIKANYSQLLRTQPAVQLSAYIETQMPPRCLAQDDIYTYKNIDDLLIEKYSVKELITTAGEQDSLKYHLGGMDRNKFSIAYEEDIYREYGIKNLAAQPPEIIENAIKQTLARCAERIFNQNFNKLSGNFDKNLKDLLGTRVPSQTRDSR